MCHNAEAVLIITLATLRNANKSKQQDYNKLTINRKVSPGQIFLGLGTTVLLLLLWCLNLLPFKAKLALGKSLGRLLYRIPNSRIEVTRTNLELCFPELSEAEREIMVKETFVNFGAGLIETAMGWWDKPEKIFRMTDSVDQEILDHALAKGKGVLLLGAHFSTLDLSSLLLSKYYRYYAIYREQTNRLLNWIMTRGRSRNMSGGIPHTSMRGAAKRIMAGDIVWYSPDQDMGHDHSVFAPFFGQQAATVTATAKIAKLTGAPLVMLVTYRKPDDSGYVVQFLPGPETFPLEDEVKSAAAVNALIEQGIRIAPTQYYWFHRRFKTQPGLEKAAIYQ